MAKPIIRESGLQKGLPKKTQSLCPECLKIIDAELRDVDGKLMMFKTCPTHGEFSEVVWSNTEDYLRIEDEARDGNGVDNPKITDAVKCPFECGLCDMHKSTTSLANLDLTNRCNLKCPVCFANANAAGYVYEPTYEQVVEMMKNLRAERPVPVPAIQFAGGEPTIYPKFMEVISKAKELGFAQIQVATNGIKIVEEEDFAQRMLDAGMHTVYLQFDGFKRENYIQARGKDLLDTKMEALKRLENTKPTPLATVLVPTMIKTINDDEAGKMVDFAVEKRNVVRAINFQPVAFTGRIDQDERKKFRYTISDLIHDLTEQTDYIQPTDFHTVPSVAPISYLASVVTGQPKVAFTAHPACGASTFLYVDPAGKPTPITRFIDVVGLFKEMEKLAKKTDNPVIKTVLKFGSTLKSDESKRKSAIKAFKKYFDQYVITDNIPSGLPTDMSEMLSTVLVEGNKESMKGIAWNTVMIGTMHFQDLYNYDIERVKRCVIHYAVPDGRIIPFCAYNGGPTYRTAVEKKFSMSFAEWAEKNKGKDINS